AQNWTERYGYPMAPSDQDDLPRVAQYMETRYNPRYLRQALRDSLRREMLRRHGAAVPADLRPAKDWTAEQLLQALSAVGRQRRQQDPAEPHRLLAQLRLPLYLTANPDNLLAEALAEANCEPQVRLCPWDPQIPQAKSTYDETPTPDRPLVYHLFGHLSEPYSVVLTEDEYFDYLIGVARNKDLIPEAVRAALVDSDLLFLGFQVDDWNFRVLLRSLMAQEGSELGKLRHSHIAAQIEPDEDRLRDPRRARRYLEKYFESEKISLYWGSLEDFLKTLQQHLAPASEASAA
ncbi:MAG: SIR2 family NAD-dependent protein deacylase, partial [Anaerolineales bacterium]